MNESVECGQDSESIEQTVIKDSNVTSHTLRGTKAKRILQQTDSGESFFQKTYFSCEGFSTATIFSCTEYSCDLVCRMVVIKCDQSRPESNIKLSGRLFVCFAYCR